MDMVEQLDQELQTTAPRIQTYELKSRSADQQLLDVLTDILGKRCVAVDKHRQLVIVTGDDELQQEAERLLREMDAPIPAIPVPSLSIRKIRIAWLVSGPDDLMEKLSLPPTLKDAADEVGRILGSPPPGLLAQSVIDTSGGQDFEMNTLVNIPTLDPCHLKIKGEMRMDDRNQPALKLRIEAAWTSKQPQPAPGRPPQIQPPTVTGNFGIDTNIKAVPDQDIVLGVSPTGDIASAFVVRILE